MSEAGEGGAQGGGGLRRLALGCTAAVVLLVTLVVVGLQTAHTRHEARSTADAARSVELLLAGGALTRNQGVLELVRPGGFADNFEVSPEDAAAVRARVGARATRVVPVARRERLHAPSGRPVGFDLVARLTLESGREASWTFSFDYTDLPLARLCVLQGAREGE